MDRRAHYYKLGLFTLLIAIAAIGLCITFGAVNLRETVRYHTFFDESVQGLELGAPVKFRGVTIGHVARVAIAPDHQHVDVVSELDRENAKEVFTAALTLPPGLRAQLATQGITGVKFVSLDVFDPKTHPLPELSFAPPERYIPATPSTLKSLEDVAMLAMERLPDIMEATLQSMRRVDRMLASLEGKDVSAEAVATLRNANQVLVAMRSMIARIDRANIGDKAAATLDQLQVAATKLNGALERLDGDEGLVAAATHATKAFGAIGESGRRTQRDLDRTLRDMSEAADAIRSLARAVERDPEMLLKGKSEGRGFK
jgi:phospholipid/cholesterol/gamma-HCH transport system substrate-binding protein